MSQEQLAEAIGASRVHMGYIEQGKRNPSLKLLLRIAEAFDVPMSKLFDFVWAEDDAKSPPVEYDSH